ncbi:MAG: aminoacyl-tRNA hydrolase [Verrucomicrobia bacterium]|nr:aminoacyl-tRNA hydrolase [Verrucomicrobiota bacterium]
MLADPKAVVPGAKPRLVAGLGNPGREYERTRHNVGFLVLDELARRQRVSLVEQRAWKGRHARTDAGTHLLQPLTFMNLSGEAVGALARFHKIPAHEVLVVSDDTALPLGRLRLRLGGSDGGHNGLRSIADHLDTTDFPRLRVGVGSASPGEQVSHVLGTFRPDEQEALAETIVRAADAVETAVQQGLETAMNRFNRPPAAPRPLKPVPAPASPNPAEG